MPFLDQIEPLKQTALAELKQAVDLSVLEQTKGAWIGANGKFTALMKQLGTLPKEEKPAAGKLINIAKTELEAALAARREELELASALPKEPTDFTAPGRRRTLGKLHPLTQVTDDIVRAFRKIGFAVAQVSLHHPIRLAEQISLLDNITKGRIIAGLGRGTAYNIYDYQGYDIPAEQAQERFEEAEAIIMQARLKAGWVSEADLAPPPPVEEPATAEAQT